jgi:hypothetical protein
MKILKQSVFNGFDKQNLVSLMRKYENVFEYNWNDHCE